MTAVEITVRGTHSITLAADRATVHAGLNAEGRSAETVFQKVTSALASRAAMGARGMAIAGGTSEVARNQIAERILGMPRDPLIK